MPAAYTRGLGVVKSALKPPEIPWRTFFFERRTLSVLRPYGRECSGVRFADRLGYHFSGRRAQHAAARDDEGESQEHRCGRRLRYEGRLECHPNLLQF